jgi:hypothetical protein
MEERTTVKIVIIDPAYNHGRWQVNLTDGETIWAKRSFPTASAALVYVGQLRRQGHRPAFASALADLVEAATEAEPLTA